MGTRSLTRVYDDDFGEPKQVAAIYRQYDGYPEGHGRDLADFITSRRFVNGISGDPTKVFNGAGCFAAALVTHLKTQRNGRSGDIEAGGVYLYPLDAEPEEYTYTVTIAGPEVSLKVEDFEKTRFEGPVDEFLTTFLIDHDLESSL